MKRYLLLFIVFCTILCSIGCNTDSTVEPSWTVPPTKFNEGKVEYTKTYNEVPIKGFSTNKIGKRVTASVRGVDTLFSSDFSSDDPFENGSATSVKPDSVATDNGVLYIPYKDSLEPPVAKDNWTTWTPEVKGSLADNFQVQLTAKMRFVSSGKEAQKSGMIGCFVKNSDTKPDKSGDGVWFSFNAQTNTLHVYAGNYTWPNPTASIDLPDELLSKEVSVDILCIENYIIHVYIAETLYCVVSCTDGQITISDGKKNEQYKGSFDLNTIKDGTYFSLYGYYGGIGVNSMSIYGCSRATTKKELVVKAESLDGSRLGLDITDKKDIVSICYSMWFDAINGSGSGPITNVSNVEEMIAKYGFSKEYGFGNEKEQHNSIHKFHYWSEPAQGYYRSTDKAAIRNNMTLLYNAGVDFIILDYTYASAGAYSPGMSAWNSYIYNPSVALLDTIMEMRAEGLGTPYVVYWVSSDTMYDFLKQYFYSVEKWEDCFVYWDNKPLLIQWTYKPSDNDYFKMKGMYGLRSAASVNQWSYLEVDNKLSVSYDENGNAEHVCAAVATQETYMSLPTAHGRDGGRFWNKQWQTVFDVRPKIVTVTWWNEWCVQLYKFDGVGYVFTDNFNQEYSRDIEPMKGGHGDQYYKWLCQYISYYKSGLDCPALYEK